MVNHVDALLSQMGNGKWNLFHFLVAALVGGLPAPFALAGAFVVPRLRHTCRLPPDAAFAEEEDIHTNSTLIDSCSYFVRTSDGELQKKPCTQWDYDDSIFSRTITSQFDLVCDRAYLRALYMSLYMLGVLAASPIIGYISDRFGRKRPFVVGFLAFVILSHSSGWMPNIPSLLLWRFLIGVTHVPISKIALIIGMETCTPERRGLVGIFMYFPWTIYTIALGGVAYLERDWRWLLTYSSLISLLIMPTLWFIDESPHWLAVRGRYKQAIEVLKKAARWNKVTLPPDDEIFYLLKESGDANKEKETEEKAGWVTKMKEKINGVFVLFRTPRLRTITLVLHLGFFAIGMVYYGLAFSGGSFNIDSFSYMALCGLTEVPATTIMSPIVERVGRKKPYILGFLSTGAVLLCIPFIPSDIQWLAVTLALVGRMTVCVSAAIIFLYGSELFPTEVRTRGITYSFMMSRVGSSIAPFITEYLAYSYSWAPSLVFGVVSVAAAITSMALRETLGTTLPDTIAFLEKNHPRVTANRILVLEPDQSHKPSDLDRKSEEKI